MLVFVIGLAAAISTYLGGLFALRFKDKLHVILGFSAGAVIGVAFFDLLPEALNLGSGTYSINFTTSLVAFGFLFFMITSQWLSTHAHSHDDPCENKNHKGKIAAVSLLIHSFLDGVAIGLAFQVSQSVGLIVAVAVLAHDFSDGINTVGTILRGNGGSSQAKKWLTANAAAPLLGVLSTQFFSLSSASLSVVLAIFCGFFIYIGASDLLPESHHGHPKFITTLATTAGVLVLFVAIQFASH